MFVARERELGALRAQFESEGRTAVLVYGKRRVGKSTLIAQAAKGFDGIVVSHLCVQSTFQGNIELLSRSVSQALGLPDMHFGHLYDVFDFLEAQGRRILVVLDEYQYLKASLRGNEADSLMQAVIDRLGARVKLVLCGSYVSVMRGLLEEGNPLFGRFTSVIHLEELDYYDAARFRPDAGPREKAALYAVFGGSPYVLSVLGSCPTVEEGVKDLLLPQTGILRVHVENVMLREVGRSYDERILEALGNGRKRYSEIAAATGRTDDKGMIDKQLKSLVAMETVAKTEPINRRGDRRKQFYELRDNLMRFYFAYVFGNAALLANLGEEAFYEGYVRKSMGRFVARRFEEIARQYFGRLARAGRIEGVTDLGTYWYDDPETRTNGEYDCVVARGDAYDFYECKFFDRPMSLSECRAEAAQVEGAPGIRAARIGFVCTGGFDFRGGDYHLIDGGDLYAPGL